MASDPSHLKQMAVLTTRKQRIFLTSKEYTHQILTDERSFSFESGMAKVSNLLLEKETEINVIPSFLDLHGSINSTMAHSSMTWTPMRGAL